MAARESEDGTVFQVGQSANVLDFSVVLRPSADYGRGLLALIAPFCASEGIRRDTGIITWIRWPDQVVTGGKSVARTSLVSAGRPGSPCLILNFRINLGRVGLEGSTSLEELLGVAVDRELLIAKVLESLSWMYSGWVGDKHPQIRKRIGSMLENEGQAVTTDAHGTAVSGVVSGVDEKGRLLLRSKGT
jgi:BirA family transcriptional regulator, biotin operon repressor / biotin---[acetyl-CoA-carboxylase] ligase